MSYYRYRGGRRPLKRMMFFCLCLVFFGFGAALGYAYDSSCKGEYPPFSVWKSIVLGGMEPAKDPVLCGGLPAFSDGEKKNEASLKSWEVKSYRDKRTKTAIPVFYAETAAADGTVSALGTALIRYSGAREVVLEALVPQKISVLIYCTHTAESYDGTVDENGRGDVLKAAHHLADTLEKEYRIGAVVSDTVHDSPDWYQSYTNSLKTASEMLKEYPDAELIIDFHRDSGVPGETATVTVNGRKAATLLLVVGSNVKLEHPHWEENWQTAKDLGACIDQVDPSLLRGIRVQRGRYNQHLSPKCVLLEDGTDLNTLSEAEYSTELVAKAIAKYLQKNE